MGHGIADGFRRASVRPWHVQILQYNFFNNETLLRCEIDGAWSSRYSRLGFGLPRDVQDGIEKNRDGRCCHEEKFLHDGPPLPVLASMRRGRSSRTRFSVLSSS